MTSFTINAGAPTPAMDRNRPADSLIVTLQRDRNDKLTGAIVHRGKSAP